VQPASKRKKQDKKQQENSTVEIRVEILKENTDDTHEMNERRSIITATSFRKGTIMRMCGNE